MKKEKKPIVTNPPPAAIEDPGIASPSGFRVVEKVPEGFVEVPEAANALLENIRRDVEFIAERRARIRAEEAALDALRNGLSGLVVASQAKGEGWRMMVGSPGPGGVVMCGGKIYAKPSTPPKTNSPKEKKDAAKGEKNGGSTTPPAEDVKAEG